MALLLCSSCSPGIPNQLTLLQYSRSLLCLSLPSFPDFIGQLRGKTKDKTVSQCLSNRYFKKQIDKQLLI